MARLSYQSSDIFGSDSAYSVMEVGVFLLILVAICGSQMAHFLSHIPIPHPQPSVLIVSYIESAKAAAQFGFYQKAEWKPDDSMIAVAVSTPLNLLILYLQFD